VKPPPPVKASSAASTSGSRLVQMLKAALSSQIRKAQEEDPGSGDGQSDAMLAALRKICQGTAHHKAEHQRSLFPRLEIPRRDCQRCCTQCGLEK
jgi:hypothetical protein